jgi:hypothetical protein
MVIASFGRRNRATFACAAFRARSSSSPLARCPIAHWAFAALQVPVAGWPPDPLESDGPDDGEVAVVLRLLHAPVNATMNTNATTDPFARIVLLQSPGGDKSNEHYQTPMTCLRCFH